MLELDFEELLDDDVTLTWVLELLEELDSNSSSPANATKCSWEPVIVSPNSPCHLPLTVYVPAASLGERAKVETEPVSVPACVRVCSS